MPRSPRVIFFDVNETLLDLQPVKDSVARALNGRQELVATWFTTLLQYSLVVTVADRYTDFGAIGAATLRMVADKHDIALSQQEAETALKPIRSLPPHPEVAGALERLRGAGYRLFTLTNSGTDALAEQMANSGLAPYFEDLLSVEAVGKFKPATEVYHWAAGRVGVSPEDCLLVAAHGWDVAGAAWAGLQTAFISRPGQTTYPLADPPTWTATDLTILANRLTDNMT
ncbi:2-haloacid dehalogenase [Lewinella marina]|uniref:Haloacid dehalogenase type II n=1 Tax=Neolewinella marina TaxID=438751 RepID=A0A2G0CGG8_9BACT|nr:haloacid dehalogenase type II [Neolewinella marina]NJB86471.1 2-haloacid dehalogenase [Neolewinella marina]PHK99069.1 haloacid dehalogenase type II [Neolewinella marina]